MINQTIILSAGGSGGHIFSAQALAEILIDRGYKVVLVTDRRGFEFAGKFPVEVKKYLLELKNPWGHGSWNFIHALFLIFKSLIVSIYFIRSHYPSLVVGFGGYPSFPMLAAACLCRVPRFIHEQNSVLGRVNLIFAKLVTNLMFGISPKSLPKGLKKYKVVGNPVRKTFLDLPNKAYSIEPEGPYRILFLGGSQGAAAISQLLPKAVGKLPNKIRSRLTVVHQCGKQSSAEIFRRYKAVGVKCDVRPFFENVAKKLVESQLVICRSGAATISELSIIGRPSILIPLPTATGNHQYFNAKILENVGGAKIIQQEKLADDLLAAEITKILSRGSVARKMAEATLDIGLPNAACSLADIIISEIEKDKK